MRFYTPTCRLELTDKDLSALDKELKAHGFGVAQRTPEHARKFPVLDELAYLVEQQITPVAENEKQ